MNGQSTKLGIGVAGTGFGRRVQMPAIALSNGFETVAVCSGTLANAQSAATEFGAAQATDNFDDLLANDAVDVVLVTTPPRLHRSMAIAALEAGKHVVCEKPLALNVREAEEMAAAAAKSGLVAVLDHEQRYLPPNRQFHHLVANGYLGELRYLDVRVCLPLTVNPAMPFAFHSWRDDKAGGGGLLSGIFSHYIDLMCHSFGAPTVVTGLASTALTSKPFAPGQPETGPVTSDDRLTAAGQFANGALFSMAGSWSVHHGPGLVVQAYGDKGTLVMPDTDRLLGATADEPALAPIESEFPLPAGTEGIANGQMGAFVHLLNDLEAVIQGTTKLGHFATFDDGLAIQRVIEAIRG